MRCGPGHGGGAASARQRGTLRGFPCHCSGGDALGCGQRRWMLREEAVDAVGGEPERGPAGAPGTASPRVLVSVRPGRLSHRPGISS